MDVAGEHRCNKTGKRREGNGNNQISLSKLQYDLSSFSWILQMADRRVGGSFFVNANIIFYCTQLCMLF